MITHRHVITGGYRLAFDEAGAGSEPVVLVHASTSSPAQWRPLLERAPLKHHRLRLLAPALPGYAGSRRLDHTAPDAADDVAAMAAFIDTVVPQRSIHLIGHSWGGAVALALAGAWACSGRVLTLTLIEPVRFNLLRHLGYDTLHDEIRIISSHQIALTDQGSPEAAARSFVRYWKGPLAWERMSAGARGRIICSMPRVASEWRQIWRWDEELSPLTAVTCPVQLITGGGTTAAARAVVQCLRALLPDARCRTIARAGHLAPITHPEEVNSWLMEHASQSAMARFAMHRLAG